MGIAGGHRGLAVTVPCSAQLHAGQGYGTGQWCAWLRMPGDTGGDARADEYSSLERPQPCTTSSTGSLPPGPSLSPCTWPWSALLSPVPQVPGCGVPCVPHHHESMPLSPLCVPHPQTSQTIGSLPCSQPWGAPCPLTLPCPQCSPYSAPKHAGGHPGMGHTVHPPAPSVPPSQNQHQALLQHPPL